MNPSEQPFVADQVALSEIGTNAHAAKYVTRIAENAYQWSDYHIIMWQIGTPQQYAGLKAIGIDAAQIYLNNKDAPGELATERIRPLLDNNLHMYVENIATDFYSAYHRWSPNRAVNWRFRKARDLYLQDPLNLTAFKREPSLSDPAWLNRIRDRLIRTVHTYAPYRPLFYDLGDETGIADLSIYWDFDLSEFSLKGMRAWLAKRYGTLAALNDEWGSKFTDWKSVMPDTTAEAMARTDDNFAAWADFKEWMDEAFARALRVGTDAVHSADPQALAAIEGAQIPGWGGYDYSRLSHAVDLMELYDGGGNLEIVRSLNPRLVILTTSGRGGAAERYRDWRELLRGSRGLILWDPNGDVVHADGTLGVRGREAAPLFHELCSGIGALLINSERRFDPIAILYSPASMRTQWMLDWKPKGQAWVERDVAASYEDENSVREAMMLYARSLERMGFNSHFLTPEIIKRGELRNGRYQVLILPHAIALGGAEADEIRRFISRGGLVIADIKPGTFDEHSRRLQRARFSDLLSREAPGPKGGAARLYVDVAPCRVDASCANSLATLSAILQQHGVSPQFRVTDPDGGVRTDLDTYVFNNGDVTILALQRNRPPVDQGEGTPASDSAETPAVITLAESAFAYDVRRAHALGSTRRLEVMVNMVDPVILALSPAPLPAPRVMGSTQIAVGETGRFAIDFDASQHALSPIVRVEILDPSGTTVERHSKLLHSDHPAVPFPVHLAPDDRLGNWTLRVTDILSGRVASHPFEVVPHK